MITDQNKLSTVQQHLLYTSRKFYNSLHKSIVLDSWVFKEKQMQNFR